MNFSQRFRYKRNRSATRLTEICAKEVRIRGGYRRPQDALLSVQGVRLKKRQTAAHARLRGRYGAGRSAAPAASSQHFTLTASQAEREQVERLYNIWFAAKEKSRRECRQLSIHSPHSVRRRPKKSASIRSARVVEYSVDIDDGHVKLKASASLDHARSDQRIDSRWPNSHQEEPRYCRLRLSSAAGWRNCWLSTGNTLPDGPLSAAAETGPC